MQECRVDAFCDLSLSIPGKGWREGRGVTVEDCLRGWAREEEVEGARCEGCLLALAAATLKARQTLLMCVCVCVCVLVGRCM